MAELSVHVFSPLCILLLTVPVSACVCMLVCVNGAVTVCAGRSGRTRRDSWK